jgi:hypothetical protein
MNDLPFNVDASCLDDAPRRGRHFGSDAVAGNQSDLI